MITFITFCLLFFGIILTFHGGKRHTTVSMIGCCMILLSMLGVLYLIGWILWKLAVLVWVYAP